jgi:hypothetical protein
MTWYYFVGIAVVGVLAWLVVSLAAACWSLHWVRTWLGERQRP